MKKFNSITWLNFLWYSGMALSSFSIIFTLITGKSPLEAMDVSPQAATIGAGILIAVLAIGPSLFRKIFSRQTTN